jgi:hypothetical protein
MPFFDTPARKGSLRPIDGAMRRRTEALVERCRAAFPQLEFEIAWDSDTVNARALFGQPKCRVVVYGGLVRHEAIGEDGLALTLAHEVGHLLGGKPKHNYHFWLSCEGVADYWATRHGLRRLWPRDELAVRFRAAAAQLLALQRSMARMPKTYRRRRDPAGRFPCLETLPPSCRVRTWRAGLDRRPQPACAC